MGSLVYKDACCEKATPNEASSKILNLNPTLHNNNYEFVKFMTKFLTNTEVRVQYIDHIERKIIDHYGNFKRYSI